MYLKLRKVEKGCYSWKNGIWVKHEGNEWNVYWCSGELAFSGETLAQCKVFLHHRYPDSFSF